MSHTTPDELKTRFWKEMTGRAFAFTGLHSAPGEDAPMTLQNDGDNRRALWIFTTDHASIAAGGPAHARYVSKGQDFFARIDGTLSEERDKALIDRLWSPHIAAWYEGGRDDPAMQVLRFDLASVEIWSGEMGPLTFVKMMLGMNVHEDMHGEHATVAV